LHKCPEPFGKYKGSKLYEQLTDKVMNHSGSHVTIEHGELEIPLF